MTFVRIREAESNESPQGKEKAGGDYRMKCVHGSDAICAGID
jgi:hypothetical protein